MDRFDVLPASSAPTRRSMMIVDRYQLAFYDPHLKGYNRSVREDLAPAIGADHSTRFGQGSTDGAGPDERRASQAAQ